MKKFATFSATVVASLVLAACSSGGKGNNETNQPSNKPSVTPTKPNITPAVPSTPKHQDTPKAQPDQSKGTGAVLKVDRKRQLSHQTLTHNANFKEQLVVDGKSIQLVPPKKANVNIITPYWRTEGKGYEATYHCCGKFDAVRFGAVEGGPYKDTYFYYNGKPTTQMPTSSSANYVGQFILSADDNAFDEEDYYRGKAHFAVDFAKKSLSGELSHQSFKPVQISATISGNGFTGNATQEKLPTANVEGKFYGENAKELGGLFNSGRKWGGAFGAEKQ